MEQQFSPGLLYSVSPENFSELHLQDEEKTEGFEWSEDESALTRLARRAAEFIRGSGCK